MTKHPTVISANLFTEFCAELQACNTDDTPYGVSVETIRQRLYDAALRIALGRLPGRAHWHDSSFEPLVEIDANTGYVSNCHGKVLGLDEELTSWVEQDVDRQVSPAFAALGWPARTA